jgi:hypothetical protein
MNPVPALQSAHGFDHPVCRRQRLIAETVECRREGARRLADALREKGVYAQRESIRGLRSPTRFRLRCAPGSSKGSPQQRRGSSGGKRASVEGFRVVDAILSGFRGTSGLLAALLRHLTSAPADRPRSNRAAKSYLATPTQGPGACPWERATLRNPAITTSSPRSSRMTTVATRPARRMLRPVPRNFLAPFTRKLVVKRVPRASFDRNASPVRLSVQ